MKKVYLPEKHSAQRQPVTSGNDVLCRFFGTIRRTVRRLLKGASLLVEKKLPFVLGFFLLFGLVGCSSTQPASPPSSPKIKVVATIFPLYDFARRVGGERVEVDQLLPAGAEVHSWEPSPKDMVRILNARVFIFNGAGLEPWAEKMREELTKKGIRVVEASSGLELLTVGEHAGELDGVTQAQAPKGAPGQRSTGENKARVDGLQKKAAFREDRHPGPVDPHVWLDPVLAEQMVRKIANALIAADPAGRDYYAQTAEDYARKLRLLHEEYRRSLMGLRTRKIIVSHEAFGYLARRYGLEQIGVMGLSPESEPDPRRVQKVVEICRKHNVEYIFFESLVSPRLAETIAREAGVRTLVLNPVSNLTPEERAGGADYLAIMRQNLDNLKTALGGK